MKNTTKLGIIVGAIIVIVFGVVFFSRIGYNRQEIQLRNLVNSRKLIVETSFDNMYRTIKDQAGITDKYADKLKELVLGTMEGRYGNDKRGEMWAWIQEQNPTLDSKIYTTLMQTVEVKRNEFKRDQDSLIAANNEHENLIADPWASMFIKNKTSITITIVSSAQTKETVKTGVDNTDPINGR